MLATGPSNLEPPHFPGPNLAAGVWGTGVGLAGAGVCLVSAWAAPFVSKFESLPHQQEQAVHEGGSVASGVGENIFRWSSRPCRRYNFLIILYVQVCEMCFSGFLCTPQILPLLPSNIMVNTWTPGLLPTKTIVFFLSTIFTIFSTPPNPKP